MRRSSPASASSTFSTGIAAIVVQFGLAMMPLRASRDRVRVDLADDERNLGVHAPGAGVVDHGRAGLGEARRVGAAAGGAGREQGDVDARRVGGRDILDDDGLPGELDGGARGARGREQAQLADREGPLGEDLAHDGADLAGGADDGDGESGIGDAGHGCRPRMSWGRRPILSASLGTDRRCYLPRTAGARMIPAECRLRSTPERRPRTRRRTARTTGRRRGMSPDPHRPGCRRAGRRGCP